MSPKANRQLFTIREREILNFIAEGYKNKEIADDLDISLKTVEKYLGNLMRKSNLHDISSVIDYALEKGLISIYEVLESRFSRTTVKSSEKDSQTFQQVAS
jgi:DNA-binding NarL/FixJ family response regulator